MKEFIKLLGDSNVDFKKETKPATKDIWVSLSTDSNGSVTNFVFDKDGKLLYVSHN